MSVAFDLFPALVTPFTNDNKVNYNALSELIEMNIKKGVTGFYVCGSTGEAFLLSDAERIEITEQVCRMVNGRVKVVAHIGNIGTDKSIELAKAAEKFGVYAVSAVPPFYYSYSFGEIKQFYNDITNSIDIPMLVYNMPQYSGVKFTFENVEELLDNDKFMGMKHTSSDFFLMQRVHKAFPDKVILNGFDEMFLSGLAAGATGGVGSTYNFMAEKFIDMHSLFENNEIDKAQHIQSVVNDIVQKLMKVGLLQAQKAIVTMMGINCGKCRAPFRPLSTDELKYIEKEIMPLLA